MKLPFVPRSDLEKLQVTWEAERQTLSQALHAMTARCEWFVGHEERQMVSAEARYAELLAKYDGLRREGFAPDKPVPPAPKQVRASEIDKVIREQAEGDVRLAAHLRAYDRTLKQQGKTEDERIGLLVRWTSTEPEAN